MKKTKTTLLARIAMSLFLAVPTTVTAWAEIAKAPGDIAIDATNFPSEDFRNYLKALEIGSDGVLTADEIANCTSLKVIFKDNMTSLKGIEHFTALKELRCYGNGLTELDLSKNTALEVLICHNNPFTELDLSKNTALKELDCTNDTLLTRLDISQNIALTELCCSGIGLTELDLSKNTALINLECNRNKLTALDVSKNVALQQIQCRDNQLTEIDITKNTALLALDCSENQIQTIKVSPDCAALQAIDCRYNQLQGAGVNALIEGLSTRAADAQGMIGFCVDNPQEGNTMTPAQVAAANQKNWMILYWPAGAHEDDHVLYEGSEPVHVHSPETIPAVEPTCTESGHTASVVCSVCDEVLEAAMEIPALGHNLDIVPAVNPTCTEPGHTASTVCIVCSFVLEEAMEIPALGHNWGEWVVTREATTTEQGEETRTCMNDASHIETRPIPVVSGIAVNAMNSSKKDVWYDLSGRKLSSKPTKRGVYIQQGRKVIIR